MRNGCVLRLDLSPRGFRAFTDPLLGYQLARHRHEQHANRVAPPQNLTIDLSHWLVLRGGEQPVQAPVELKRARLNLAIRQPIGTDSGEFQVAISNGSRVLVQSTGQGKLKNGITTVRVQMDCSKLHPGKYTPWLYGATTKAGRNTR